MSYFSNLSHTSFTSTESSTPSNPPTNNYGPPRQRASSSNLRTNSKLSLSISASADPKDRERALTAHPLTSNQNSAGVNGVAALKSAAAAWSYSSGPTPLRNTWVFWFRQQRSPGNKITNYEEGIKKITAFSSVGLSTTCFGGPARLAQIITLALTGRILLVPPNPPHTTILSRSYDRLPSLSFWCPETSMGGPSELQWRKVDHPSTKGNFRPAMGGPRYSGHRRPV